MALSSIVAKAGNQFNDHVFDFTHNQNIQNKKKDIDNNDDDDDNNNNKPILKSWTNGQTVTK